MDKNRKYVCIRDSYNISKGTMYDMTIEYQTIHSGRQTGFMEYKYHFIDDTGEKNWCGVTSLNDYFVIVSEWREMQLLELGL